MAKIVYWALVIYEFIIILEVFKSFLVYFTRNNKFYYYINKLSFVDSLTAPYLNIFRKLLPPINGLDFSPMIGLVILQIIEKIVYTNLIIN